MIRLRLAMRDALGPSLTVTHAAPSGPVELTVPVVNAGRDDETPYPGVWLADSFGRSNPASVGGRAEEAFASMNIEIGTQDDDEIDGFLLLEEIHEELRAHIRAVEASFGDSYFTFTTTFRDYPTSPTTGGNMTYVRIVTVQAQNLQSY